MADQIFNVDCGFFNAIDNDRTYSADDMNMPYKKFITNGVLYGDDGMPGTELLVVSAGGMTINVNPGNGLFADKWFENPSTLAITVPDNTDLLTRRDSVIVQVDLRSSGRVGNIVYRTGTPSSPPAPPAINTTANVIEYRLANIDVAPGASAITADEITDTRGMSECPWSTSKVQPLEHVVMLHGYYTTQTETDEITIMIGGYDPDADVLMVYINGIYAELGVRYTIEPGENGEFSKILLTNALPAGQTVNFVVLHSVLASDMKNVKQWIDAVQNNIIGLWSSVFSDVELLKRDSGWLNATVASGISGVTGDAPQYRRMGKNICLRGAVTGATGTGQVFDYRSDFSPAKPFTFVTSAYNGTSATATVVLQIDTSSDVSIIAVSGTLSSSDIIPIATTYPLE